MRRYHGGGVRHSAQGDQPGPSDTSSLLRAFDSESNPTRPVRPSPLTASSFYGLPLDLLERIRSFPLFQSAPESFLAAIGARLKPQLHSPRDYILTEGDDAKAMFWLVRGSVAVTSRDGESVYAELKPGAFFGEIGVMMDIPRTATIVARTKSFVVKLNKEDLQKELPKYPEVEKAIRDEATERLAILERKKKENVYESASRTEVAPIVSKRPRDPVRLERETDQAPEAGNDRRSGDSKRRKSPSPSLANALATSALRSGYFSLRQLLKELPLFSRLPADILHWVTLNAQTQTFPPFTDIIRQHSQGREIFFIVSGDVEVVTEASHGVNSPPGWNVKARLRAGQYFGEVVSLSLAPRRTATVRSVTAVECLVIGGDVLDQLWQRCSPDLRKEVEQTARQRLGSSIDGDATMTDVLNNAPGTDVLAIAESRSRAAKKSVLPVIAIDSTLDLPTTPARAEEQPIRDTVDPDPFLDTSSNNIRPTSRRSSLAAPSPSQRNESFLSPLSPSRYKQAISPSAKASGPKRPKLERSASQFGRGSLPDSLLACIFQFLDIRQLLRLRQVSLHWCKFLTTSPHLLHSLDLSTYNRKVTDTALSDIICPFVGARPRVVDLSNCFHVTDKGFNALVASCGSSITALRMKSVWEVSPQAVLQLANNSKAMEEIDLSNCRKVSDNLLARIVGWVVPDNAQRIQRPQILPNDPNPSPPPTPGTVIGCPSLKKLTLSYCKHISDRSMAHFAAHASQRLEYLDFTRCTTITDLGFQHWSVSYFPRLQKLCLADCTYLSDNAVVYLTNAAKGLKELDLSFCCALSDTAVEVLSLGCPNLVHLNLAFCGSAVSDSSLRSAALHLLDLRALSVRGCVRVTGAGVETVLEGCRNLERMDISQCKSLTPWLHDGGIARRGKNVRFETIRAGLG